MLRVRGMALAGLVVLCWPAIAQGAGTQDAWLPSTDDAKWVWSWSNSAYSPTPRTEEITVDGRAGELFRLRWAETGLAAEDRPAQGTMDFRDTAGGIVNVTYQSSQPPPQFPVLCASAQECGNSTAGTLFALTWGSRSPTLAEPLVRGARWNATGGAANDVASASRYVRRTKVRVPAFPQGVEAAEVESEITQGGALGDPFGTGVRTVWWVYGVGPVKVVLRHQGGEITTSELQSTTLTPRKAPSDANLFPLRRGAVTELRWRNSKHMRQWSRQRFEVVELVNGAARVEARTVSGPLRGGGQYTFAARTTGVTHLQGESAARTRVTFPALGPRRLPADKRRRFLTPYDLLVYGFGPVLPGDAKPGATWRSSRDSADFRVFGVDGTSRVLGSQLVRVPAGRFQAVPVRSTLRQPGFRFGSGTRTAWFAPDRGLVRLVFRHDDGSVSTVERLR